MNHNHHHLVYSCVNGDVLTSRKIKNFVYRELAHSISNYRIIDDEIRQALKDKDVCLLIGKKKSLQNLRFDILEVQVYTIKKIHIHVLTIVYCSLLTDMNSQHTSFSILFNRITECDNKIPSSRLKTVITVIHNKFCPACSGIFITRRVQSSDVIRGGQGWAQVILENFETTVSACLLILYKRFEMGSVHPSNFFWLGY